MARKKIDILATSANPQANCRLLGLTAEIRNTVWEFTLSVESDLNSTVYFTKPRYVPANNSVLRLLETCRFIYCEALGIFYTVNHLRISATSYYNGDALSDFRGLTRLPSRRLTGIQQLTLQLNGFSPELFTRVLKLLPLLANLKQLRIMLYIAGHPVTINGTMSDLGFLRENMTREKPLLDKAAAKCASIEHLEIWHAGDVDINTEFGQLVRDTFQQIIKAMPYWKAKKAAALAQASIATADDDEAQAT